tara:strand:+ start:700 stop:948 length:249 start_codon:yes stop_codon:yes gene_type:complete
VRTDFKAGDIVIDEQTGDIGLLLERFDILEHSEQESLHGRIFAWDIIWTGSKITDYNRYTPYTETGLDKCISDGVLTHFPNI